MAKKNLTCELLTTVKGLDPKNPQHYVQAGTPEAPVLVDLPDDEATRALIRLGALRIWPGTQSQAAAAPGSPSDLKSLRKAEEVLISLIARYRQEAAAAADAGTRSAIEADLREAEADLARLRDVLK